MVAVSSLGSRRQSDDVARPGLRQHPFERHCGQVVALVDHDLPVGMHDVVDLPLSHEALDQGDVEATVGSPLSAAELPDLLRLEAQEHAQLRDPLVQERPAMHQNQCAAAAFRDEPRPDRRLSGSWRRDEDPGVVREERLRRPRLSFRQATLEDERNLEPGSALVLELQCDAVLAKERLERTETAPRQRHVQREILCACDDPWRRRRRQPHALPLVELGVLEGREALDLVDHGRGKPRLLDEEALGEHGAHLPRERLRHARSRSGARLPPTPRLCVPDLGASQAHDRPRPCRLARDSCHRVRTDARHGREVGPLLVVGNRRELLVQEDGVSRASSLELERKRDQVADPAPRQRVLAGEETVVRVQAQRGAARQRLGEEVATHRARCARRNRSREEEPHVAAVSRSRSFDGNGQPGTAARFDEGQHIVGPGVLVEVDGQEPARLVIEERIETQHVATRQVGEDGGIVEGDEVLVGALTALGLR
jgi:hypothetical protein